MTTAKINPRRFEMKFHIIFWCLIYCYHIDLIVIRQVNREVLRFSDISPANMLCLALMVKRLCGEYKRIAIRLEPPSLNLDTNKSVFSMTKKTEVTLCLY